jgi:hypothetical protein
MFKRLGRSLALPNKSISITETRRVNMKRITFAALAALTLWGGVGLNFANAQFGTLGQAPIRPRPTVSPFINLGQGGVGAYYGVIQPQLEANRAILNLQQGLSHLNPDGSLKPQQDQTGTTGQTGLQTGHSATFFNTGGYFPQSPGTGSANLTTSGLGGGINTGLGSGFGLGNTGVRTFFGNNLAQPLIRP